jgi:hypothetical protein
MMSSKERQELTSLARLRAKVARNAVEQREKELLADVEAQLSATFEFDEEVWADITREAKEAVARADQQIAQLCRKRGVPEEFRPSLSIGWWERGENASAKRRAELRRLAQAKIAVFVATAKAAIEAKEAEIRTELIAGGLESSEARAFLESMPTAEHLMPRLAIGDLEVARNAVLSNDRQLRLVLGDEAR